MLTLDNSYARELEGLHVPWKAETAPEPRLVAFNHELAAQLGIDASGRTGEELAGLFSGNAVPDGASPIAQAYAGHQFGHFSPQLGDGRALLLGEVRTADGRLFDVQLKGSGRTPFSRGGDGKAALGPVLREYLVSEAMHVLGVPTTRSLAAVVTGAKVWREEMLPGAVLTRIASSHVRVGTFQFFAARGEWERVKRLGDYVIARHYPELGKGANRWLGLLEAVRDRQAALVAQWMNLGFIHGVMNTDNMAISGETIDYGPCAFMEAYDPATVFSSIDSGGRYAYGNQPQIAAWNLARLAETLLPFIDEDQERAIALATGAVNAFGERYHSFWLEGMRAKLGLAVAQDGDMELVRSFLEILFSARADFTLAFRHLGAAAAGDEAPLRELAGKPQDGALTQWLGRWQARLAGEARGPAEVRAAIEAVNPLYIPRNHKVEEALTVAVEASDYAPFHRLLDVLADPFTARPGQEEFAEPAPAGFGPYVTFCGT